MLRQRSQEGAGWRIANVCLQGTISRSCIFPLTMDHSVWLYLEFRGFFPFSNHPLMMKGWSFQGGVSTGTKSGKRADFLLSCFLINTYSSIRIIYASSHASISRHTAKWTDRFPRVHLGTCVGLDDLLKSPPAWITFDPTVGKGGWIKDLNI